MIKCISDLFLFFPIILNSCTIIILINPAKTVKFHPLTYIFILITITFIITVTINLAYKSWISFILFLIIIGGLIIVFLYITRLANNESISLKFRNIISNFIKISPILVFILLLSIYNIDLVAFNLTNYPHNLSNNLRRINSLYKIFYNKSTIFLIIYLYFSIICIINICSINKSPLRQILFYE